MLEKAIRWQCGQRMISLWAGRSKTAGPDEFIIPGFLQHSGTHKYFFLLHYQTLLDESRWTLSDDAQTASRNGQSYEECIAKEPQGRTLRALIFRSRNSVQRRPTEAVEDGSGLQDGGETGEASIKPTADYQRRTAAWEQSRGL